MGTDFRKEIGTTIDQRRDEYTKISDAIWGFAEPRFQEYESTKLQQEFLKSERIFRQGRSRRRRDRIYRRMGKWKADPRIFRRV